MSNTCRASFRQAALMSLLLAERGTPSVEQQSADAQTTRPPPRRRLGAQPRCLRASHASRRTPLLPAAAKWTVQGVKAEGVRNEGDGLERANGSVDSASAISKLAAFQKLRKRGRLLVRVVWAQEELRLRMEGGRQTKQSGALPVSVVTRHT